jgi:hypothetical protein
MVISRSAPYLQERAQLAVALVLPEHAADAAVGLEALEQGQPGFLQGIVAELGRTMPERQA